MANTAKAGSDAAYVAMKAGEGMSVNSRTFTTADILSGAQEAGALFQETHVMAAQASRKRKRLLYGVPVILWLVILTIGALCSLAILMHLSPTLKKANGSMTNMDELYHMIKKSVNIACKNGDMPPDLIPIWC